MDNIRIIKVATYIFICISNICATGLFVAGIVFCILYFDDMDSHLRPFLCLLGILIGALAGVGIYAVLTENVEVLTGYAVVALIFFVIQIVVAVLGLMEIQNRTELTRKTEGRLLQIYYEKSRTVKLISLVMIQVVHKCCGVNGPDGGEVKLNSTSVMGSCCGMMNEYSCPIENAYQQGCLQFVVNKSVFCGKLIGTMNIVSGAVHLFSGVLAAILACFLVNSSNRN